MKIAQSLLPERQPKRYSCRGTQKCRDGGVSPSDSGEGPFPELSALGISFGDHEDTEITRLLFIPPDQPGLTSYSRVVERRQPFAWRGAGPISGIPWFAANRVHRRTEGRTDDCGSEPASGGLRSFAARRTPGGLRSFRVPSGASYSAPAVSR